MLKNLLKFMQRPIASSEELDEKLRETGIALADAQKKVDELGATRRKKLLLASNEEIAEIDAELAAKRREIERLDEVSVILSERRANAAKGRPALDRKKAKVEKLANEMIDRVRRDYPAAAKTVVELINDVDAAEIEIRKMNEELVAAGRGAEAIPEIETRAIRFRAVSNREAFRLGTVSLPPALDFPGYGDALVRAHWDGLET